MQINHTTILKGLPPKNCEKHRILANTPTAKIAWQEGTHFCKNESVTITWFFRKSPPDSETWTTAFCTLSPLRFP